MRIDTTTNDVESRLAELGLVLPEELPPPAGAYEPFRLINGFGALAAQVPGYGPEAPRGRVGAELTVEQGRHARARSTRSHGYVRRSAASIDWSAFSMSPGTWLRVTTSSNNRASLTAPPSSWSRHSANGGCTAAPPTRQLGCRRTSRSSSRSRSSTARNR